MFQKGHEDLKGLPRKATRFAAVLAQLAGPEIQLEVLEACEARREGWHTYLRRGRILTPRSEQQPLSGQIGGHIGECNVLRCDFGMQRNSQLRHTDTSDEMEMSWK